RRALGDNDRVGRVLAFVPDLMDRSRVTAAAAAAGVQVEHVASPRQLASGAQDPPDLVLVDLSRPGALEVLGALAGCRTVGFASHVDRDLIAKARAAGCARVLARSTFFGRLGELLGEIAGEAAGAGAGAGAG
ncbi:MAG: hypothetical protein ACYCR4_05355, partial [Acidimicrobiales bacterium]